MQATEPAATFAGSWRRAVQAGPDAPFLIWDGAGGVVEWSYAEFDAVAAAVAGGLRSRGVGPGDAVHLALANSPAFVAVWLACARIGAWMVPSDPHASAAELAAHIRRTRPVVSVGGSARRPVHQGAVEDASTDVRLTAVVVDEDDIALQHLVGPLDRSGIAPGPLDRMAVMFTSGTTSAPKGVELTQANYAFAGDVMAAAAQLGSDDRQLVVLPLFHANAQYYSFCSAISVGASVALVPRFSASRFGEQATRLEATHASLFAAPMRMILARGGEPVRGGRLRHAWYAQNVTPAQYEQISAFLGCRPRQLYGMTETLPAVLTMPSEASDHAAMGAPTPGCTVQVWDDDAPAPAAPSSVGRVVVRGRPGYELFAGYLDDPVTTDGAIVNRELDGAVWFDTGDRAWIDGDGLHRFAGRRGDVLKVAGENVSTVEVESVLAEHPAVLEAAVVGVPDAVRDEVPVAYVVLHAGSEEAAVGLRDWADARLAPSKRPRSYHVVAALPRTSVGKVRKHLLTPPVRSTTVAAP